MSLRQLDPDPERRRLGGSWGGCVPSCSVAGKRKSGAGGGAGRPPARKTAPKSPAGAAKKAPNGRREVLGANGRRDVLGKNGKLKKQRSRGAKIRRVLLYVSLFGLACVLLAGGSFAYLYQTTDLPDPNEDFKTNTSFVYYSDGKTVLGEYAKQNRDTIPYDTMPQEMKDAVVAAENRTFWSDSGIDYKGILRAVFNNAQGNATQGASTITQQYLSLIHISEPTRPY